MQEFRPAGQIEDFFDVYFALARDGKLNAQGLPNLLHMAVIASAHWNDIQAIQPSPAVQKLLFAVLAPIGRLAGYRARP